MQMLQTNIALQYSLWLLSNHSWTVINIDCIRLYQNHSPCYIFIFFTKLYDTEFKIPWSRHEFYDTEDTIKCHLCNFSTPRSCRSFRSSMWTDPKTAPDSSRVHSPEGHQLHRRQSRTHDECLSVWRLPLRVSFHKMRLRMSAKRKEILKVFQKAWENLREELWDIDYLLKSVIVELWNNSKTIFSY